MEITVQFFEGCPNVSVLTERLAAAGVDPDVVRFVSVASPAEAEAIGFRGSPTVLVDDEDRFAQASAPAGFACRVYRTEAGLEGRSVDRTATGGARAVKPNRGSGWMVGAVAAIAVVCCAFPVIVLGALSVAAGMGIGSWLLVGIGIAAVASGITWRRRHVVSRLSEHDLVARTRER